MKNNETLETIQSKLSDIEDLIYALPIGSSVKSNISIDLDQLYQTIHDNIMYYTEESHA